MKLITRLGNGIVGLITGFMAVVLLLYGGLMLRDVFLTEVRAFASFDLMQYRPNIEENEPPYLDELLLINPDTTGWITIYNTNIDYPVMQGETDMEYINKDVYGDYTVTGSIFMSSENEPNYSEPYTLLYGHHMTNGAMFGDLPKFKDKDFFENNSTGILIREAEAYDLTVMALLETDAYDSEIYEVKKEDLGQFAEYIKENATHYRELSYEKILALSTCNDANTAGRTVLICGMNKRKEPLPGKEHGKVVEHREAIGHPLAEEHWGLITLITLAAIIYFALRILFKKSLAEYRLRKIIGLLIALVATIVFVLSENLRNLMQMVDKWTPLMIGMLLLLRLTLIGTEEQSTEEKVIEEINENA